MYLAELCSRSFLPFWSFANPKRSNGKELCDAIVVCDPYIVLISVKEIMVSSNDPDVAFERWTRRAVENSVKQLYGAQSMLAVPDQSFCDTEDHPIALPEMNERQIFRLAVAFGSDERFPIMSSDFGEGFVHVIDEKTVKILFAELDTITDFVTYLMAKENLVERATVTCSTEADLLAYYFNYSFEGSLDQATHVSVDDDLWQQYIQSDDYLEYGKDMEASYFWDAMIHSFYQSTKDGRISQSRRAELERAFRRVNYESRLRRKHLSLMYEDIARIGSKARIVMHGEESTFLYVLMRVNETNWSYYRKELSLRCFVARVINPGIHEVIGVCCVYAEAEGFTWDFVNTDIPEVTPQMIEDCRQIQQELGFFVKMQKSDQTFNSSTPKIFRN